MTAQVTRADLAAGPLQTSTQPTEARLGWHNRNSVIPALMQPVNQLTQSTQPKGHWRSFKATPGSSEQVTSGTSPSFTHGHKVSTSLKDLPVQGLEETHGRRNNKAQCPCAGFPHCCHQENRSSEEKNPTTAVISDHQVLSHLVLFLRGSDPWVSLC